LKRALTFGLLSLSSTACIVGTTPNEALPPIDEGEVLEACAGNQTTLAGDFTVRNAEDLAAIDSCVIIDGTLIIEQSDLTNLDALENLTEVDGPINIIANPVLENIDGLGNVTAVRGGVGIVDNPALTTANFGSLAIVEQSISIVNNAALERVDFGSLTEIEVGQGNVNAQANLEVLRNPALRDLEGFDALTLIGTPDVVSGDTLIIAGNDSLDDLSGLDALTDVDAVVIGLEFDNDANPLASGNASLTNLGGLGALVGPQLGADPDDEASFLLPQLTVAFNPDLTSLAGLTNLRNLTNLTLLGNDSLGDLTGLEDLVSLTNLNAGLVFENPNVNGVGDPVDVLLKFGADRESADPEEDFLPVGNGLVDLDGLEQIAALTNMTFAHNLSMDSFEGADALLTVTNLTLAGNTSLADFTGLEAVTTITNLVAGEVRDSLNNPIVFGNGLETLEGLDALTTNSTMLFAGNVLGDLNGLLAIAALPSLNIYADTDLPDLTGLAGIDVTDLNIGFQAQADGTLLPVGNDSFSALTGLDDTAVNNLHLGANPDLDDLTTDLVSINTLVIAGNEGLTSLAGFDITTLGTAVIGAFPDAAGELVPLPNALEDLTGFATLAAAGDLSLIDEPLETVDLPALAAVTGVLALDGLAMTNLTGLDTLAAVGDLTIRNNVDLDALTGLGGLVTITGNTLVENNESLADVAAFGTSLDVVNGNVFFLENPEVTAADVQTILDGVTTFDGEFVECGNDGDEC
jgi:hypothetical protein